MNLTSGVSLGQLIVAFGVILLSSGAAWGSLLSRVKTLEREVAALSGLSERIGRIETTTGYIKDELGKLTSSWLFREPPTYDAVERPMGQPLPPKPRRAK